MGYATKKSLDEGNEEQDGEHSAFKVAPNTPTNASPQALQYSQGKDTYNTQALRRSSRKMTHKQGKGQTSTVPRLTITTPQIKKKQSLREQAATGRTRRKQWMDAEIEKLTAEYMKKSGGDLNKAAGFWFEREEWKRQQPWRGLVEGEAFIEDMKKDVLDPLQVQLQMEEEEEEEEEEEAKVRKPLLFSRLARKRGPGIPTTVPAGLEARRPATSTTFNLTTPTKTVVNPEPPLAESGKQPTPPTSPTPVPLSLLEKQVPPLNTRKRKRSEVQNLVSDLGEGWAVR